MLICILFHSNFNPMVHMANEIYFPQYFAQEYLLIPINR